jgi:hypothetical protein
VAGRVDGGLVGVGIAAVAGTAADTAWETGVHDAGWCVEVGVVKCKC